jgi:hypothetical protein
MSVAVWTHCERGAYVRGAEMWLTAVGPYWCRSTSTPAPLDQQGAERAWQTSGSGTRGGGGRGGVAERGMTPCCRAGAVALDAVISVRGAV